MRALAHPAALLAALLAAPLLASACTEPNPYLNLCGNGVVEPANGEECDDGDDANHDRAACTSTCQLARCGDGLLLDEGPARPHEAVQRLDDEQQGRRRPMGDALVDRQELVLLDRRRVLRHRPAPLHRTMTRTPHHLAAALALALWGHLACQPAPGDTTAFTTAQPSTSSPMSTGDHATTHASTSGTGAGTSTSASTTEVSTTAADTGASASTTLLLDVGTDKDVGDPKPPGCQGKIDFLFVLSRAPQMEARQAKLIAAFPHFIETIQAKFADFDFHIMVVDGEPEWGAEICTNDCPVIDCKIGEPCCPLDVPPDQLGKPCCPADYPCFYIDQVTACDETIGAGNVIAAGDYAANKICPIAGGRRYLTKDQPNLVSTFSCAAQLGTSGWGLLGEALTAAMQPAINAPGGCNAGFLRPDALLMVTFIGGYDYDSKGEPEDWATAVLAAKKGDPGAVVMLDILDPKCPEPYDRICTLVKMFPYHLIKDTAKDDYVAAFDEATNLVEVACADFIPG